ncbi:MAG: hypothetical protein PHT30_05095 [Bacilli bacterium]|nr:hypothetical protein [Bacilli bacterium]
MDLLVHLFPFTHYNVVGFSYEDKTQVGYNEECETYDKILVANITGSSSIKNELILKNVSAENIITVKKYPDKDKFDGDAIECDFSNEVPDNIAWVIVPNKANGLLWHFNWFKCFRGENTLKCDYIVDMKNHFSMMMDDDDIGHYNPWDYYFQPMSSLTLEEAYSKKGTIISKWTVSDDSKRMASTLSPIFSDKILEEIDTESASFFGRKKVLGVVLRGTDYISVQFLRHGIPLDEYELVEIVEERMESLGFTDVYLSTEDQDVHDTFMEHFGNRAFSVKQKRFKKGPILTSVFDEKIVEPFGKLIQGKRYLIATHMVTKCKSTLVCLGAGSEYVVKHSEAVIERHIKGNWGLFGDSPLIVCSHNKNHFNINDKDNKGISLRHTDSKSLVLMETGQEVTLKDIGIYLDANKKYVCSFSAAEPKVISLSFKLFSKDGESKILELKQGDVFIVPFDVCSGNAIIKRGTKHNSKVGIQIEEGSFPTEFEPSRYSWTQICIKDVDGNEFVPEDVDYIDFNTGIFSVNGAKRTLNLKELYNYHQIVCFKGGFITYRVGEYRIIKGIQTKTSFEKIIDSKRIIGKPKQLRRFSHTIGMADHLIEGSQGDVEKALCIYHYHAMNYDTNATLRLARIYSEGKVVEKDFEKSAEYFKKVADVYPNYVAEATDFLLRTGNSNNWNYAFEKCFKLSSDRTVVAGLNAGAMGRLGRMYRDGKGVEKNLQKAIEWTRKATDINLGWKKELMDLLWQRSNPEDLIELVNTAKISAKGGDVGAMGRLGRMYRDGKGVEKNLEKSAEYFKIVADKYPNWVAEATDVMLKTTNFDNWNYAFRRCSEIANDPSPKLDGPVRAGAMGRISHMYRDGKGVDKDLNKAVEWMRKAVDNHPEWANELEKILFLKNNSRKTD